MFINRTISKKVLDFSRQYPVITITGPRQSGKTTLCRHLFPEKQYVSLENRDTRNFAIQDPNGFLAQFPDGAIIDEVQRVPDLTSYIQTIVDSQKRDGLFILTGSQSFELMGSLSQSLAGRTAVVKLLPFSMAELYPEEKTVSLEEVLYKGFYPRIHDKNLDPTEAYSFYVSTYLERDMRTILKVQNLLKFETFLKMCAGRTGQILNLSSLGNDCGINHNTAKSWISLLETSFIIKLVSPYSRNIGKRLIKAPKLFFLDTGLAAHLMGINDRQQIAVHPLRGAIFETLIYSELLKQQYNAGKQPDLLYYRDSSGNEIDIIHESGAVLDCYEVKSGSTIDPSMFKGLLVLKELEKDRVRMNLVYGGAEKKTWSDVNIIPWRKL